jgi:catechol 2,3-dioxygenase-like lactoylglutathione lyase family enzyme
MATVRSLVHEVDASIEFYTKYLGFELIEQMGSAFAIVANGNLNLWLSGHHTSAARPMPDGCTLEAGGWNHVVMAVDDLESLAAAMKSAGVAFRHEIITGPGGKQILAEAPSGNPIEIFQPA